MDFDLEGLHIIRYPDVRLRKSGGPVEEFDESLAALAARMFELMHGEEGLGLAAPQVGIMRRLFVCNITGDPKDDVVFVNPTLHDLAEPGPSEEGCLSIPDVRGTVQRYLKCRIRAFDVTGKPFECEGTDLAARCWQHECDHLDGRLILDRFSEADKIAARRKLKELEARYKPPRKARV